MMTIGGMREEGLEVVCQYDGSRRSYTCRYRTHACRKDRGNQQSTYPYGQRVDNEIRKHEVGLCGNVGRQKRRVCRIVAVESRSDEEEQSRDGNEQLAAEECREPCIAIALGSMVALHVILVDAIVLQIDEDAINQAYPEG